MPCPPHPPWLDHSNYIWRIVQVMTKRYIKFWKSDSSVSLPSRYQNFI
jgi:hypothetical protein